MTHNSNLKPFVEPSDSFVVNIWPKWWTCYIAVLIIDVFEKTCGTQHNADLCPRNGFAETMVLVVHIRAKIYIFFNTGSPNSQTNEDEFELAGPKIICFFFSSALIFATWCNAMLQVESSCIADVAVRRTWCGHPNVLVLDRWNVLLLNNIIFKLVELPQHQNDSAALNFVGHVTCLLTYDLRDTKHPSYLCII